MMDCVAPPGSFSLESVETPLLGFYRFVLLVCMFVFLYKLTYHVFQYMDHTQYYLRVCNTNFCIVSIKIIVIIRRSRT